MKLSKNIFLIEDDKDDQLLFSECIEQISNASLFDIAHNGSEALEKLENSLILPDIIFMDINMPLMNGLDCLAQLINNPRTKNISVVMLSSDYSQAPFTYKHGAKAFILKTHDCGILKIKLEEIINLLM